MSTSDPVPPVSQMPAPVTAGAAPWFTSNDQVAKIKVAAGVVALAFPKAAIVTYLHLGDPVKVSAYINAAIACWPMEVLVVAFVKRMRSALQPLVSSWAQARKHPATRALVEVQAETRAAGIPLSRERQAQIEATPATAVVAAPPDLSALASALYDEMVRRQAAARARAAAQPVATAGQDASTIASPKVSPAPLAPAPPEPPA